MSTWLSCKDHWACGQPRLGCLWETWRLSLGAWRDPVAQHTQGLMVLEPPVAVSREEQRGLMACPLWPRPSRAPGHGDRRRSPSAGMGTRNGLGPVGEAPRWGRGSLGPSPGATSMEGMVASVGGPGEAGGGDNTPGDLSADHPGAHCMWGAGRSRWWPAGNLGSRREGFLSFFF